ncbi:MAG: ComEC/Rec2 family competence protein [Rickettsiales bacterium]|nr:ComEC/Rec2 family competence protein [Rickettsiales bacterium]
MKFILCVFFIIWPFNSAIAEIKYYSYQKIEKNFHIISRNNTYLIVKEDKNDYEKLILFDREQKYQNSNLIKVAGYIKPNICFRDKCYKILSPIKDVQIINKEKYPKNYLHEKSLSIIEKYTKHYLAYALITGAKIYIPKEIKEVFFNIGISHILAISGLHIGGVAFMSFLFFRRLIGLIPKISLNYNSKKIAAILSLFTSFAFLAIANFPISGQRALLFILFFVIGILLEIKIDFAKIILISAIFIALNNADNIFSPAFQLSFVATLIIALYYQHSSKNNYFIKIFYSSILVSLATLPFICYHFNNASIIAPIANLFLLPIASFIIVPLGFLCFILVLINEKLNLFFIYEFFLDNFIYLAKFFNEFFNVSLINLYFNGYSLIFAFIALLILLVFKDKKRFYIVITLYFSSYFFPYIYDPKPDLTVSYNKLFIVNSDNNYIYPDFIKNKYILKKAQNYFRNLSSINIANFHDKNLKCHGNYCVYEKNKHKIALILKKINNNELQNICLKSDLVVNYANNNNCNDQISLKNADLMKNVIFKIYLKKDELIILS